MNVALWIVQILLALMFVFHGRVMWVPGRAAAQPSMAYVREISPNLRKFIGTAEILAGIGMILPGLLNILPVLTPLAGVGLVIVMGSAAVFHFRRKENTNIVFNLVLLVLAAFVAYGRFVISPF